MRLNYKEEYSIQDIYNSTNNGYDVFKNEIEGFTTSKNIKNPFTNDRNPSCRVKQSNSSGLWLLYTYNEDGKYYTAIEFIKRKYGLNTKDAIKYISDRNNIIVTESQQITQNKPKKSRKLLYEYNIIPFTEKHTEYWLKGGLNEEFVNNVGDIYAIDKYSINKNVFVVPNDEIMFVYIHRNIQGKETGNIKFLRIGKNVEKENKWRTDLYNSALWYTHTINDNCKNIFIVKSNKDALINMKLGLCCIVTQSENSYILSQNMYKLKELFPDKDFIIVFGSDKQGTEESIKVTQEHDLQWFNIPAQYLNNNVNDPFSFVAKFGEQRYKELLIKKGYL